MSDDDTHMEGGHDGEHVHVYELLMPFVVCQSNGGPYDDDSFVAGWELGSMFQRLETGLSIGMIPPPVCTFRAASLPQVELWAMANGLMAHVLTAESYMDSFGVDDWVPTEGWVDVQFRPPVDGDL